MFSEERLDRIEKAIEAQNQQIDKNTSGIRDLIHASGIFLEQQKLVIEGFRETDGRLKETDERFKMLMTMQEDTWRVIRESDKKVDKLAEKLDRLADLLERFLKGLQRPNGNQ
jgi:hypothetical protein